MPAALRPSDHSAITWAGECRGDIREIWGEMGRYGEMHLGAEGLLLVGEVGDEACREQRVGGDRAEVAIERGGHGVPPAALAAELLEQRLRRAQRVLRLLEAHLGRYTGDRGEIEAR